MIKIPSLMTLWSSGLSTQLQLRRNQFIPLWKKGTERKRRGSGATAPRSHGDFLRGTCFPSAATAWERRRNHSGEGVQELNRPCRR